MSQPYQSNNLNTSNNTTGSTAPLNPQGSNFQTQPGLTQEQIRGNELNNPGYSSNVTGSSNLNDSTTSTGGIGSQYNARHAARDTSLAGGVGAGSASHALEHHDHHHHNLDQSHVGRDTALGAGVGGVTGHHEGHHHTGRDAAIGATAAGVGAHELDKHREHHDRSLTGNTNAGVGATGSGSAYPIHEHKEHLPHSAYESHHIGRDAALGATAGGIAGHHDQSHHHTGRDATFGAAAAGIGAHDLNKHEGHHNTTGTSSGLDHGSHDSTTKPSLADKIGGTMDTIIGKITKDPAKVEAGQARKEGLVDSTSSTSTVAGSNTRNTSTTDSNSNSNSIAGPSFMSGNSQSSTISSPSVIGTGLQNQGANSTTAAHHGVATGTRDGQLGAPAVTGTGVPGSLGNGTGTLGTRM